MSTPVYIGCYSPVNVVSCDDQSHEANTDARQYYPARKKRRRDEHDDIEILAEAHLLTKHLQWQISSLRNILLDTTDEDSFSDSETLSVKGESEPDLDDLNSDVDAEEVEVLDSLECELSNAYQSEFETRTVIESLKDRIQLLRRVPDESV